MGRTDSDNETNTGKSGIRNYIVFIIIGAVLLAVIVFIIIRVAIWSKGQKLVIDPNEVPDVSFETEDNITFLPPSMVRDDDDGKNTFLIIGNECLTNGKDGETMADIFEKELKGEVTCVSFPGTSLSSRYPHGPEIKDGEPAEDFFTFYWLTIYIHFLDFDSLNGYLEYIEDDSLRAVYKENLDKLAGVDYENLDYLVICYDGHDYLLGRDGFYEENNQDITTLYGSLYGSFGNLKDDYPNLQWIIASPYFCMYTDETGAQSPCDLTIVSKETLPNMMNYIINFSLDCDASYIDNYFGSGISVENADEYLEKDGITLTEKGVRKFCDYTVKMINGRLL